MSRPGDSETTLNRLENRAVHTGIAMHIFREHSHIREPKYLQVNFSEGVWTYTLSFSADNATIVPRELAMWMLATEEEV